MGQITVKRYHKPRAKKAYSSRAVDFIRHYTDPMSTTAGSVYSSAKKAGYTENMAWQMENRPERFPFVQTALDNARDVGDRMIDVPTILAGIKKETTTKYSRDRLRAWELLGKYKGMFKENVEITDKRKIIVLDGEDAVHQLEEPTQLLPEASGGTGEEQDA